jgi:hypothetical protein
VRFSVRFLRYRGRILPWREVVNRPAVVGDLRIEECRDEDLRRFVRTATLHDCAASSFNIEAPRLFDVRLMAMSPSAFSLSGLERIEGADYAQSWLVESV